MAGPILDAKLPFGNVSEFLAWVKNSSPWKSLDPLARPPNLATEKEVRRENARPLLRTKRKPTVTFSERQTLRKKGAPVVEAACGGILNSPGLSFSSFDDRQKLRKKGARLSVLRCASPEVLSDSVDHLFPGAVPSHCQSPSSNSTVSSTSPTESGPNPGFFYRRQVVDSDLRFSPLEKESHDELRYASSDEYESADEGVTGSTGRRTRGFRLRIKLGGNARRLVSGAIAGAFSRTAVAPLETIRTHMMVGAHGKSFTGVLKWILENEGWPGLFRGNAINVIRVAPSKAIELFVFDKMKILLTRSESRFASRIPIASVAGATAGISSTVLMYPLELLKTRLTIQPKEYRSIGNAFLRIVKEEGVGELYRGLGPSVVGVIPYAGTNYFTYDSLRSFYKKYFKTDEIGNIETLLIGSAAGAIASAATFPLEVARKQLQVGALKGRAVYANTFDCLACIFREEGISGLYRGLGPSCLKLVPAAGLSFMCYEALKRVLLEEEEKVEEENTLRKMSR